MSNNSDGYRQSFVPDVLLGDVSFAARWPEAWLRIERASAALQADTRILACKHVVDGHPIRSACIEHPGAGIQCPACAKRHTARHSDEVETRCDACGTTAELIYPNTTAVAVAGIVVGDTKGRHRPLFGALFLYCSGVCPQCREAA